MIVECLSCGVGFGPGVSKVYTHVGNKTAIEMRAFNHVYAEPVQRGKDILCPSCDKMEQRRGYCYAKDTMLLVWNGIEFVEIKFLSPRRTEAATEAMVKMKPAERRKYLLDKKVEKE